MKKLLTVISLLFVLSIQSKAQRAGELNVWNVDDNWNHSGLFVEGGLGIFTGSNYHIENVLGVEINAGYRLHLTKGLCWDVAKVGSNLYCHSDIGRYSTGRIMTGLLYNTPRILAGKSLYVDALMGYQFCLGETYFDGFAYEFGLGVKLTRNISVGVTYEAATDCEIGYAGLRFSYQF